MLQQRKFVKEKPKVGETVSDANGNRYEVTEVGLKYLKVKQLSTGFSGIVGIRDVFVVPTAPKPDLTPEEEFK